ncbi:glutathione binding-like protein [Croceicoccus sediminis]|uniref:glutathione binding-like protein n=1 Tax=Croceicoccus sediminis TaxID=2571150 RepID=UPI001181FBE2|nr:glutathione binding-like protein [Croceicoccus sediminis]
MKFYHEIRGCSLAVDIVARELAIPLDLQWVDMATKTLPGGVDYHAINPKGTVPTLELPDGQFLTEGAVIMQYLADSVGTGALLPAPGTIDRLRVLEWNSFIAADLHKGGFMPLFKAQTPPSYREIAVDRVCKMLSWIDSQLCDRTYLVADRFTIADAHCYTIAMWGYVHAIPMGRWPSLEAYLKRIGSRDSVRAALAATQQQAGKVGRRL